MMYMNMNATETRVQGLHVGARGKPEDLVLAAALTVHDEQAKRSKRCCAQPVHCAAAFVRH
jgi:hypothetical protein